MVYAKEWHSVHRVEDRKVKLASSEFDGYALRWWDSIVQNRRDDNEVPCGDPGLAVRNTLVPTSAIP